MKTEHDDLSPDYLSRLRPRPSETFAIGIPTDVRISLERVAAHRKMSVGALVKSYIGQALREDLALLYTEQNGTDIPVLQPELAAP